VLRLFHRVHIDRITAALKVFRAIVAPVLKVDFGGTIVLDDPVRW